MQTLLCKGTIAEAFILVGINCIIMNLQTFNLKNSSVLNEEELMVLLGGGIDNSEPLTKPSNNTDKCGKCDKCAICF